jgi:hypothetical protein
MIFPESLFIPSNDPATLTAARDTCVISAALLLEQIQPLLTQEQHQHLDTVLEGRGEVGIKVGLSQPGAAPGNAAGNGPGVWTVVMYAQLSDGTHLHLATIQGAPAHAAH